MPYTPNINPLEMIRGIAVRSIDSRMDGSNINISTWKTGSVVSPFDITNIKDSSPMISSDSGAMWFMMGISVWGGTLDLVAE